MNLDVPVLVERVLEQRIAASWRDPPVGQVERLERYARALEHAHHRCLGLVGERPDPAPIARELGELRAYILRCVRPIVLAGRIDAGLAEPYLFIKGYRSLARWVCRSVEVCHREWAQFQNASPLTRAELEQLYRKKTRGRGKLEAPARCDACS